MRDIFGYPTGTTRYDPAVNGGKLGHVFVTLEMTEGKGTDLVPGQVSCQVAKTVGELDWDGKTVWSFGNKAPGGGRPATPRLGAAAERQHRRAG